MSKQQNALRLALEALRKARRKVLTTEECHAVIMSIKEALAEQKSGIKQVIELYDSPDQPAQQEPFGYFRYDLRLDAWVQNRAGTQGTPFYTSPPPQRTWVGLTEKDKEHLSDLSADPRWNAWIGMEQTEAKLKDKNNA